MEIRNAQATNYAPINAVPNAWWGGRKMSDLLPKLFFVHFAETRSITANLRQRLAPSTD